MTDSLRFEVIAPAEARRGTAVPITLRLTNLADHPVDAHFLGREIAFDIVIRRADATVVWRRLEGKVTQGILQIRTLKALESIEWRDAWMPQAAGHYVIEGVLPSDDPEPRRTSRVGIEVN